LSTWNGGKKGKGLRERKKKHVPSIPNFARDFLSFNNLAPALQGGGGGKPWKKRKKKEPEMLLVRNCLLSNQRRAPRYPRVQGERGGGKKQEEGRKGKGEKGGDASDSFETSTLFLLTLRACFVSR